MTKVVPPAVQAAPAPISPPLAAAADQALSVATPPRELLGQPPAPDGPDANGFDPADYEWLPVARRPRHDGWEPHVQRAFIEALADSGSIADAARAVKMSTMSCYRLRRSPDAAGFARAWDAAILEASGKLVDVAFDRALNGVEDPVIDRLGQAVYVRRRYSDRLLMFLLAAHQPDRYGFATDRRRRAGAAPDAAVDPALPSVAAALAVLEPVPPANPHLLMHPVDRANLMADLAPEPEPTPTPCPPAAASDAQA